MASTHELLGLLYNHCLETFRHSLRVGEDLYGFTNYLGMDNPEQYFMLGTLHDIGKIRIPSSLLNKKERLTKEEILEIRKHASYGEEILRSSPSVYSEFHNIILYHHENVDGSGYFSIKGAEIPLISKMIRIVDTYDTMFNGRVYREAIKQREIIDELLLLSGVNYEESLVIKYIAYLKSKNRLLIHKNR